MPFDTGSIITFVLILIRVSAFLMAAPFFSMEFIPGQVRLGLALALSVALFPFVAPITGNVPGGIWGYVLAAVSETGVGLGMGYAASFVFNAVTVAGQYMDLQTGFAMATLLNPGSGLQTTVLAQYLYFLAMVIFLNVNGHLLLIADLARSYQLVPLAVAQVNGAGTLTIVNIFAQMFVLAVQIAAPLVAVLFIIEMVLGFLGRTAPQLNVFQLSFPINVAVGLVVLAIILPMLAAYLTHLFDILNLQVLEFVRGLT